MDYDQEVIKFLARAENLPIILELGDKVYSVKEYLWKKFSKHIEKELKERLNKEDELKKIWEIETGPNFPISSYTTIEFKPQDTHGGNFVRAVLESDGRKLYYGVVWNEKLKNKPESVATTSLVEVLQEDNFKTDSDCTLWFGWKYDWPEIKIADNEFYINIARNVEQYTEGIVEIFWNFFQKYTGRLKDMNDEIRT